MSDKIVIVGIRNVGATAASALMLRGIFNELVLIDADPNRAAVEAIDIADANALARPTRIRHGNDGDMADKRIIVLTAGAATHGEETRLSVASRSAVIVRDCAEIIRRSGFSGILVVASNPVDATAQIAQEASGLPPNELSARVRCSTVPVSGSGLRRSLAWRPLRSRRWPWESTGTAK